MARILLCGHFLDCPDFPPFIWGLSNEPAFSRNKYTILFIEKNPKR